MPVIDWAAAHSDSPWPCLKLDFAHHNLGHTALSFVGEEAKACACSRKSDSDFGFRITEYKLSRLGRRPGRRRLPYGLSAHLETLLSCARNLPLYGDGNDQEK